MTQLRIAVPALPWSDIGNYLRALDRFGAKGVVIYSIEDTENYAGLLLPGGWDADPALYGERNIACEGVNRELDDLQMKSLELFTKAGKPILGICRGEQLINVFFGGSLIQHLPTAGKHSRDEGVPVDKAHMTTCVEGCFLARLYGTRFPTNSSHHQGVCRAGCGLKVVQKCDDGVVEGIEHESLPIWGVQWHPERMCFDHAREDTVDGSRVIKMFLDECQKRL